MLRSSGLLFQLLCSVLAFFSFIHVQVSPTNAMSPEGTTKESLEDCWVFYVDSSHNGRNLGTKENPFTNIVPVWHEARRYTGCMIVNIVGNQTHLFHTYIEPISANLYIDGGFKSDFKSRVSSKEDYARIEIGVSGPNMTFTNGGALRNITILSGYKTLEVIGAYAEQESFQIKDSWIGGPSGCDGILVAAFHNLESVNIENSTFNCSTIKLENNFKTHINNNTFVTGNLQLNSSASTSSLNIISNNEFFSAPETGVDCIRVGERGVVPENDVPVRIIQNTIHACAPDNFSSDGIALWGASGVIARNEIDEITEGIHASYSGRNLPLYIVQNFIEGGEKNAAYFGENSGQIVLIGNVFRNKFASYICEDTTSCYGVFINDVRESFVENNVFFGFENSGLWFDNSSAAFESSAIVQNNIIAETNYRDNSAGLFVKDSSNFSVFADHNDFYRNGIEDYSNGSSLELGDNNIFEKPEFVNKRENNFQLQESSPCLNNGHNGLDIGAFGGRLPDYYWSGE